MKYPPITNEIELLNFLRAVARKLLGRYHDKGNLVEENDLINEGWISWQTAKPAATEKTKVNRAMYRMRRTAQRLVCPVEVAWNDFYKGEGQRQELPKGQVASLEDFLQPLYQQLNLA